MDKITVIGAGNVGATVANMLAHKDLAREVVLVDIKQGIAEGKALDIWQSASIDDFSTRVVGVTDDYTKTAGSGIVVITSGLPRKPGMSRDDLIKTNAVIVKEVAEKAVKYSPDAIFIVVSNPLDVMTYAAMKATGLPANRVIGMAGILDTARFSMFVAEALNVSARTVNAILLGGHGDTMVPLPNHTSVGGVPLRELLPKEKIDAIVERTKKGGGELVALMGTSAWYAPGSATVLMVESIVRNQNRVFPCCVLLNGEYGLKDVFLGVPVALGKNGVDRIVNLTLNEEETKNLHISCNAVKEVMKAMDDMKLF
ncbi:MAG: malate dehydrogenase [Bacteroidales bacterium]